MGPLLTILTILFAVGAGIFLSRIPALRALSTGRAFSAMRMTLLCAMVAAMGFRIGRTDEVLRGAGTVGLASAVFAGATIAGTLLVLAGIFSLRRHRGDDRGPAAPPAAAGPTGIAAALIDPLLLLGMLGSGFLVGWLAPLFPGATGAQLVTGLLYCLLVIIGLGLGSGGMGRLHVLAHPEMLLVPIGTAVGSLAGGLAAGLALGLAPGPSLSVSAGFGWYSLSGVILTRLDGPRLGAIAFLSNMLRESAALVLIPILARTRFPLLAVGAGGATAMDVTLPLIEKNCGARAVPFCIASGGILSLSVPFLVPLLHSIG